MSGGILMRPRERQESGEQDLFRSRLDQVINIDHALVKLARTIDWRFLEEKFGAVYKDGPGQPPLPTRLMAGLAILKHTYNFSDEVVCELWLENPYYQHFCGEEFFQHRLPLDRSSMTNWRNRMGEERLQALLQESLAVATRTGAMKPGDLARVIVDTYASGQHPRQARWSTANRSGSDGGLGLLVRLPIPWKQVGDFVGGVIWKPGQHVSEPGLRIDVVHLAGFDQGIDGGGTMAASV